nr:MAG TPA: hypothetical protein [Caudoviricetes sp.]
MPHPPGGSCPRIHKPYRLSGTRQLSLPFVPGSAFSPPVQIPVSCFSSPFPLSPRVHVCALDGVIIVHVCALVKPPKEVF